jgi:hypothetical protein
MCVTQCQASSSQGPAMASRACVRIRRCNKREGLGDVYRRASCSSVVDYAPTRRHVAPQTCHVRKWVQQTRVQPHYSPFPLAGAPCVSTNHSTSTAGVPLQETDGHAR